MSNERFEELVNLYLDAEIGRRELDELKRVVKENALRRQQFEKACQLHQAARKALVGSIPGQGGERHSGDHHAAHAAPKGVMPSAQRPGHRGGGRSARRSMREAQKRAQVNATVEAKLDRQESQGAAATLKLTEVGREHSGGGESSHSGTRRTRVEGGGNPLVWVVAAIAIACALAFSMVTVNPESEELIGSEGNAAVAPSISSYVVPEGMRGFTADGDIQLMHIESTYRARILINSLAGDSVSRDFQVGALAMPPDGANSFSGSIWTLDPAATPPKMMAKPPPAMENPSEGNPAALQRIPPSVEQSLPPTPPAPTQYVPDGPDIQPGG